MRAKLLAVLRFITKPAVAIGGSIVIAAGAAGAAWYLTNVTPTGAYTPAEVASITQEVDVSGPVQSAQTTNLSFQVAGSVAAIDVVVGQHVAAGQTLVTLDGGTQAAALASAEANLQTAQANLAELTAGTRPEELTIDQNTVTQDQSALRDAIQSAYVAADTAVHADVDPLFQNPRTASASFTPVVPDSNLVNTINQERVALEPILDSWNTDISAATFATDDPTVEAGVSSTDLSTVTTFLNNVAAALAETPSSSTMSQATLSGYEETVAEARTSVAGAESALTGATTALVSAEGALTLAQEGSTPQSIAAGQAEVNAAQAAVDAAQVSSGETVLVAPISGTITAQNADPGQTVAIGTVMISMESDAAFEALAPVSEDNIAEIKVGDQVNVTFDAYPGVIFPATVTTVNPAATMTNGVAGYQVTVTFSQNDPRITAGLTAHLAIITATVTSALVIPDSAVITDASGDEFVYVKNPAGGPDIKTTVTTGIESAAGEVQILSGLSAGQEVITFGDTE